MLPDRSKVTKCILLYYFLNPQAEHYVNELARQLSLDPKNTHTKLCALEKMGLLSSEWRGNQRYFSLAKDFPFINEYKTIVMGTIGVEAELRKALSNIVGIDEVHIFGSYAADQMDMESDIDILVVGEHDPHKVSRAVFAIQKTTGRDIQIVNITSADFKKRKNEDLFQNILSGKTIQVI